MVIGLDIHKRSVYGTVMENNGALIVQRNMENNIELVNWFLSVYKDHDIVIESSTSGKYLSRELSMLGYKVHLINPFKVPEISNNYKKTDKEAPFQLADVFRKGGMSEIYIPSEDIENITMVIFGFWNASIIILYFSSPVYILPDIYITSFIYLYKSFVIYISLRMFNFEITITNLHSTLDYEYGRRVHAVIYIYSVYIYRNLG